MKKSETLRHYADFIATLRDFQEVYEDYATAVRESVNYCIENDILADFLREQGGKIVSILNTEYNEEIARRVYGEEQWEEGWDKGREEGRNQSKQIIYQLKEGKSPEDIANDLDAPLWVVNEWKEMLGL